MMNVLPFALQILLVFLLFVNVARRNELVVALREGIRLVALPAILARNVLRDDVLQRLEKRITDAVEGAEHAILPEGGPRSLIGWRWWNLGIEPLGFLVLFLIMAVAEVRLSGDAFGAMLHQSITPLPVPFDVGSLLGLVYIAVGITFFAVGDALLAETTQRTSRRGGRWGVLSSGTRRVLLIACAVGFAVTAADGFVFAFWKAMQTQTNGAGYDVALSNTLAESTQVTLSVLLLGASALSGFTLWTSIGVFGILFWCVAWLVAVAGYSLAALVTSSFEGLRRLITAVFDIAAWALAATWNTYLWAPLHAEPLGWIIPLPIDTDGQFGNDDGPVNVSFPGRRPGRGVPVSTAPAALPGPPEDVPSDVEGQIPADISDHLWAAPMANRRP